MSTHGAETLNGVNSLATGLANEAPQVLANLNRVVNNLDALVKAVDPDRLDQAMGDVETILNNSKMASPMLSQRVKPSTKPCCRRRPA